MIFLKIWISWTWTRIRIRIQKNCWIRIHIKLMRIHTPQPWLQLLNYFKNYGGLKYVLKFYTYGTWIRIRNINSEILINFLDYHSWSIKNGGLKYVIKLRTLPRSGFVFWILIRIQNTQHYWTLPLTSQQCTQYTEAIRQ